MIHLGVDSNTLIQPTTRGNKNLMQSSPVLLQTLTGYSDIFNSSWMHHTYGFNKATCKLLGYISHRYPIDIMKI
jgi:hypothetical protein